MLLELYNYVDINVSYIYKITLLCSHKYVRNIIEITLH